MHSISAQKEMVVDRGQKNVSVLWVDAMACPIPAPPAQCVSQSGMSRRNRAGSEIEPDEGPDTSRVLDGHDVGMLCHTFRFSWYYYLLFSLSLTSSWIAHGLMLPLP